MSDFFKKKKEGEGRTRSFPTKWKPAEFDQVEEQARIRKMSVNEFIIRTALGRHADVRFDQEIVLALNQVVREIRRLYNFCEKEKLSINEVDINSLREVLDAGLEAMLRITK